MSTPAYSRDNPSPRYREMLALYQRMHVEGEPALSLPPEQTFAGGSLGHHAQLIGMLVQRFKASDLLDYGCGKASLHRDAVFKTQDGRTLRGLQTIWGLNAVRLYDPGYQPYSAYPEGRWDGVISTDVLEHIPEEDVPWLLGEIFRLAGKFIFVSIACYAAKKTLPNGENAHITQRSPAWWTERLEEVRAAYPAIRYFAAIVRSDHQSVVLIEG